MDHLLKQLLDEAKKRPGKYDLELLTRAWEFSNIAHTGQKRKSGEPFLIHPTQVATTLIEWGLDNTTIVAALLHDTVEDGGATKTDITTQFGPDVAQLVEGVTNVTSLKLKGSDEEQFVENLRKMFLVMAKDIRVVLVRLADRLHNMNTLHYLPRDKQIRNAKETLEIYAPLAERLGMGEVTGLLNDLSFKYLYPREYEQLTTETKEIYEQAQQTAEVFKNDLINLLEPTVPNLKVNVRRKRLYSLWRKLKRPEIDGDINKIHDLVAARVITETPEQCYVVLGLIHGQFHPVPYLGMTDYIANPKPNGYQSIHTKVFGPQGKIVEVQIRSQAMHEQAEMGIAAHWQYAEIKSSGKVSSVQMDAGNFKVSGDKLSWVRQLMSWQAEIRDNDEYLKSLRIDAFQQRILVFSPKGDVYDLPVGATPIDYAYAVHTRLGNQAIGAKVNNKQVSLNQKLNNGDVVEIVLDRKRTQPNQDWAKFVVTTAARQAIHKSSKK